MKTFFAFLLVLAVAWSPFILTAASPFLRGGSDLAIAMRECGYDPHPISDVAWELYYRGYVPRGTAGYYTWMMRSKNIPVVACMDERLPEYYPHWSEFYK